MTRWATGSIRGSAINKAREIKHIRVKFHSKCLFLIGIQSFDNKRFCSPIAWIDPKYKHLREISGFSEIGLDWVQSLAI